jgi:phosphoglycolate phosphatase-like HAD superfamily hydrolase
MAKATGKLFLIDHDGTLCQTNPFAFESIKYAALDAVNKLGHENKITTNDWDDIFSETSGTTEKNLARFICNMIGVPLEEFEKYFYSSRANWFLQMKKSQEFIFDTYYPDAEFLINKVDASSDYHLMMVTGNPENVMDVRLSTHLRKHFCNDGDRILGGFGNECFSRQDLIKNAIEDAIKLFPDFVPSKNNFGFYDNVYYIGDGYKDFKAGIYAKVKTIWIPSRSLPMVKEKSSDEQIKLLMDVLGSNAIITNNLESKPVLDFIGLS